MRRMTIVIALAMLGAQAPGARTVWVLQAPDQMVEYDTATFSARRTVSVPPGVFERPDYLAVNARGQVLFAGSMVWAWDGGAAHEWPRDTGADTSRQWFLSADGDALFAFETRQAIERDRDGVERSVRVATRLLRTDLSGGGAQTVFGLRELPSCACETGACSETCPVWTAWAPDGTVGNLLLATRFIDGQLQSDYEESVVYRREGASWAASPLPAPVEDVLAASADGRLIVDAVYDSGCCGWINESSDRLVLVRQGTRSVLYDEWNRFDNRNYDASFPPSSARFDPSGTLLAYTIVADAPKSGEEIRLSSDGKDNAPELARIRKTAAAHPTVEIVSVAGAARPRAAIAHAELVGWLDSRQILVAEDGRLVVYDAQGAKLRDTPVRLRSAADAFLR